MDYLNTNFILAVALLLCICSYASADEAPDRPVKLILDTDMGNDIDDALALAMIHGLAARGQAELLAVTLCKDNPWAAVYVDLVDHFYGRPDVPVGAVRKGVTPEDGNYIRAISELKSGGKHVFPRRLTSGDDAPEAVSVLRKVLAAQPDASVVFVSIGFLTNIARLLESGPDAASPLSGADLVRRKVRLYSLMAGDFSSERRPEYNALGDGAATRTVLSKWPTPMVLSGFEIGLLVPFPAESIEQDFAYAERHPIAEAYRAYEKMPYDRPSWDLTSVLYAVFPDRGYFGLSPKGKIALDDAGRMVFTPGSGGNCRYLTLTREQAVRVREAFVWLATSPPK